MSRATIARGAGAAAILGGRLRFLSTATHPSGLLRASVPGSVVGMLLGVALLTSQPEAATGQPAS